ncbi:MarR family winged helix-turn-helix transcriptional regulator [Kaistia nematophila]|uniref:MarR family transcriptional regulator n=1 Tax=Kaistia nematophila TaxID=2994654 RepID=A0A9X3E0Q4_9HYPH|nr:MarR family transcriptional regulator [Kaistia nematophila]MBN9024827.1 MarR family transcriptional regulator [Hyphomicrobiales bacterium]MCX5569011.1 MarR family transcriptional regulator [Kaistia nematophila]
MDAVDEILKQWNHHRPDLDVEAMGPIGRLGRIVHYLTREMDKNLAQFGLTAASFDVLAPLRRSGPPYRLSPGDLLATMMVTSGTLTNRIDQLEKAGLVVRLPNPDDRRSLLISLTEAGFATIDAAVTAHVETQKRLISILSPEEQAALDPLLRSFLAGIAARELG